MSQVHLSSNKIRIDGVKQIIAVGSGKGGVGKSTTAVNLALALCRQGVKVGLLDADIYGPNQPRMLGAKHKPELQDNKFQPLKLHGIEMMSMGLLVEDEAPMIWRGPMVSKALQQLLYQTRWGDLDYLIVDLPPGTGDVQLTLLKRVPLAGALIVTTPQDIAALDARKGLEMFRKMDILVLGIIENMSTHTCSQCGHCEPVFGEGGADAMAVACEVDVLGRLPLQRLIAQSSEDGTPVVVSHPEAAVSEIYRDIANKVAAALELQLAPKKTIFPDIVVE